METSAEGELGSVTIPIEGLDSPALLTIWPFADVAAKGVEPIEMTSLRGALQAAFAVLGAGTGSPWIITQDGLILTPVSLVALMAFAGEFGFPEDLTHP